MASFVGRAASSAGSVARSASHAGLAGRAASVALALALAACSSDPGAPTPPVVTIPPAPAGLCAEGFSVESEVACADVPLPATCPGGTRPRLGSVACEPVGWQGACPIGTSRDASGFACASPPPPDPCAGATREAFGAAACVPVGDCAAPFPPAGAIVVDASFTDLQLDATHARTVGAALAAAADGATIAVQPGTYEEALLLAKPVTLVGRCAASVELRAPASSTRPAFDIRAAGVTVRGFTATGHVNAISVTLSGEATVEAVVVRGAVNSALFIEGTKATIRGSKFEDTQRAADGRGGFAVAVGQGADATIDETTLTGGIQGVLAVGTGTKLALTRAVVTGQAPDGATVRPTGISVLGGAHVTVAESVFHDLVADGAVVTEDDGTVEMTSTIVRGIHARGSSARGYGLTATLAGHLAVTSSVIAETDAASVLVRDAGSTLTLTSSSVLGPTPSGPPVSGPAVNDGRGNGIVVHMQSKGTLDGVAVVGAWALGIFADSGAALELKRSLIDDTRGWHGSDPALSYGYALTVKHSASLVVSDVSITRSTAAAITVGAGGQLRGDHVLVRDVLEGSQSGAGSGLSVGAAGIVDLDASAVVAATSAGVFAMDGGSSVRLARSSVRDTRISRDGFAHGVVAGLDARAVLVSTSVTGNTGIGVAVDGAKALVDGAALSRNGVGIHAQGGSFLVARDDADDATLADGEVRVTTGTRFVENQTRVGSGVVPLPAPVLQ